MPRQASASAPSRPATFLSSWWLRGVVALVAIVAVWQLMGGREKEQAGVRRLDVPGTGLRGPSPSPKAQPNRNGPGWGDAVVVAPTDSPSTGGVREPSPGPSAGPDANPEASPGTARVGTGDPPAGGDVHPGGKLLPSPEPVTPISGAAAVQTDLLSDAAFVAAVHAAGAAEEDEPGRALRPGGRPPVVVSIGDAGFLPMLRNFIATSIRRHSLRHTLVVALADDMCDEVPSAGGAVTCVRIRGDWRGGAYGSPEFARIVNIKSEVVMAVVKLGYDALLVDGDIVFLQDPLPGLAEANGEAAKPKFDLQIQDDAEAGRNSGFMHVMATPGGLAFIAEAVAVAQREKGIRQQPAVNKALSGSAARHFNVRVLPDSGFPCGKAYFERPRRMFAHENPCRECVIMHNNWIVSTVAKVHRFRNSLQWLDDGDDNYYSDADRSYLELGNPAPSISKETELLALKAAFAVGRMLGRAVILPEFRCHGCDVYGLGGTPQGCKGGPGDRDACSFTAHYGIRELLKGMGEASFRERMFRYNPLTPEGGVRLQYDPIKSGIDALEASPEGGYTIATQKAVPSLGDVKPDPALARMPADKAKGPSDAEIRDWFGGYDGAVLRFEHLYGVAPFFSNPAEQAKFDKDWAASITKGTVRQYD